MASVETGQVSPAESGQMPAAAIGSMSAAATGQMAAVLESSGSACQEGGVRGGGGGCPMETGRFPSTPSFLRLLGALKIDAKTLPKK